MVFCGDSFRKQDVPYTAFSPPDGQFEYLVTPMGLSCSPEAFNRLIQKVFADQSSFCKAYFDDLFVYTETNDMEDHLVALEKVLERCKEERVYIKLSKCTFCAWEIPCLGDFIGIHDIRMDPDNNWPKPRTKRELQSFLGTWEDSTKQLQFNELHLKCFEEFKCRLSKPPVIVHPDFDRMFCVKKDASDFSVGGYLYLFDDEGKERVIGYGG
ncbi:reverse transcriptase [Phytophthora megakarya]|uniref:Reverse transcriptase n=1 Tax=Phytophthora megakarya TaxID=4795 RepID=A0A225WQ74_9STRA|nr:reverse transcriptase [Phytophthora megakarya]